MKVLAQQTRVYKADRGIRLRSSQHEIVLRNGDVFDLAETARARYVLVGSARFSLNEDQYAKMIERSRAKRKPAPTKPTSKGSPAVPKADADKEIVVQKTAPDEGLTKLAKQVQKNIAGIKAPNIKTIARRVAQGKTAPAGEFMLPASKGSFKSQRARDDAFAKGMGIINSVKKRLAKVFEGRQDEAGMNMKVVHNDRQIVLSTPIEWAHHQYADLQVRLEKSGDRRMVLTASVMTDEHVSDKDRLLLYRSRVVQDFFAVFFRVSMLWVGNGAGSVRGPIHMKTNIHSKYLANEYFISTVI